jgi:hypothetical protein
MPDVDLFVRSSGEQRTSNFLLWQSAYAEMVFLDTLFPDFDRRHLWQAVEIYARRDRRFGGALDTPETAHDRYRAERRRSEHRRRARSAGAVPRRAGRRRRRADLRPRRRRVRVQGLQLEEGLDVLNLTCVVAWDLPFKSDVPTRVALGAGEGLFGTPRVIRGEHGWDVTLRYAFPAAGLDEKAMGTLLMLVVGSASGLRTELTGAT